MAKQNNTVPLGQAGTGSAFVLGQSQAANELLNNLEYNQQIAQKNALLKQQQAEKLANTWQQNALKVDAGLYWQPEFEKRYQDHFNKGIQLRQMGVNPWNYDASDSVQTGIAQDYLLERQSLLADAEARKSLESEVKKNMDLLRKNPAQYYQSDIEGINNYISTPFSEAKNMSVPMLTERFNPTQLLDKITPAQVGEELVVGNKKIKSIKALPNETRSAIISAYNNTPETARWVDEITGRQGFTISQLERIPNTKEDIRSQIDRDYKGNPELRTQLASQGITPNSDSYKQFVNQEADRLYNAKSRWNNQIESDLAQVLPKVKQMSSVLPDYSAEDQAMKRENLSLRRQANARAESNFQRELREKEQDGSYNQYLQDLATLKPNAVNQLKAGLDEIGGKVRKVYDDTITIDGKKTRVKNALVVDVPTKVNARYKDDRGRWVTDADGAYKTKEQTVNKRYVVGSDKGGKESMIILNQILNKTKSFGAEKQNKVLPYSREEVIIEDWED